MMLVCVKKLVGVGWPTDKQVNRESLPASTVTVLGGTTITGETEYRNTASQNNTNYKYVHAYILHICIRTYVHNMPSPMYAIAG